MSRPHPRIYPANEAIIAKYAQDHPAVRALQVHAEACDVCVGKEIEWPKLGNHAIDQKWFSRIRLREQSFSAFAYEFISYDLILDGWLAMAPQATEWEFNHLTQDDPLMRALLNECEEAARDDGNTEIVPLIAKAREFLETFKEALLFRFEQAGIVWPQNESEGHGPR